MSREGGTAVMPHKAIRSTAESVARAEKSPDILGRTYVVQHDRDGHFLHRGELFGRGPAELFVGDFAHNGFGMVDFGVKSK